MTEARGTSIPDVGVAEPASRSRGGRSIRTGRWFYVGFLFLLMFGGVPTALFVLFTVRAVNHDGTPVPTAVRVVCAVVFGVGVGLCAATIRVRGLITDDELVAKNFFRTCRIRWDDIDAIELVQKRFNPSNTSRRTTILVTQVRVRAERPFVVTGMQVFSEKRVQLQPLLDAAALHGVSVVEVDPRRSR